jgi:HlyD family secretion protein
MDTQQPNRSEPSQGVTREGEKPFLPQAVNQSLPVKETQPASLSTKLQSAPEEITKLQSAPEEQHSLPIKVEQPASLSTKLQSPLEEQVHLLEEDEFLPSLSPWVTFGGMGLVILFSVSVLLASVFKFSETVKAAAVLRPVGELKVAQSSVEGVVEQIYVQENQDVSKGDIVARLDDSRLRSKISQLYADMQQATMQVLQINSQIKGIENQIIAENNMMARTVAAAEASVLEQQNNYENLRTGALADYEEASAGLSLALQEMQSYRDLEAAGAVPKLAARQKEASTEAATARVRKLRALMNPTSAPIVRAKELVIQEKARGEASLAGLRQQRDQFFQNRIEAQNIVARSQIEIGQAEKELKGTVVRATADGTVLQLNLRNTGQVVQAGQAIASIAPPNYALLVKAKVGAGDINKVMKGSEVQMRVNGCSHTEYGTLNGIVKNISVDTVGGAPAPGTNDAAAAPKASAYEVTIQPKTLFLGQGKNICRLKYGMDGRADIITRKQTVLEFILKKARLLTDV